MGVMDLPRVYRSTDPGAPQLSGQAGALAAILDAVLVDGYGVGVNEKAPLGWIRAFSGTNKRVYRNDPDHYSGNYLRVDDSAAQFAAIDGYGDMTDVDTGTERFATASAGWGKSNQANSNTREWIIVGTGRIFYISIGVAISGWHAFFAGDVYTLGPADIWRFAYGLSGSSGYVYGSNAFRNTTSSTPSAVMARSHAGVVGQGGIFGRGCLFSNANTPGNGGYTNPLPTTGGIFVSRATFLSGQSGMSGSAPRAFLPGIWFPEHGGIARDAVYSDIVGLPPGTELLALIHTTPLGGTFLVDITNEW